MVLTPKGATGECVMSLSESAVVIFFLITDLASASKQNLVGYQIGMGIDFTTEDGSVVECN